MYPLTELATGLAFVWVVGSFGFTAHALILAALALALIIMTGIDFRYMIIPDSLQILMALLGVAYIFIAQRPLEMLFVGPLIGFAFAYALRAAMFAWKKREALGFGDVKFFAVVGLYLDSKEIVAFLFLSGAIGIAIAALWRGMKRGEAFPFGPALGFALFLCLMLPLSIDRLL